MKGIQQLLSNLKTGEPMGFSNLVIERIDAKTFSVETVSGVNLAVGTKKQVTNVIEMKTKFSDGIKLANARIETLRKKIEKYASMDQKKISWANVGDMVHVNELLFDLNSFLQ